MIRATALALVLAAPQASAEFVIAEGTHFVMHRDYDHVTNTFTDTPADGEGDGCFRITRVDLAAEIIDFTLVSGTITPWWADGRTFHPGFSNAFVPATAFMENNPDAEWTDLLHEILKTVPDCAPPAS
ncbi:MULTISPECIES: hypothetical protein [unclassified Roseovarius]|uniref:hypothetical protein n=1 Tax=unclassified Roseovarius TaxID=2614913 RepID=UPI00273FFE08|nr:hypothetical protein [Roseovarius sp. MMSF_3350]